MSQLRIAVELGPKAKKVVVHSPDWPGLVRGAKTEEAAIARLLEYVPRYARAAELAGLSDVYPIDPEPEVVERFPGTSSTDFWGISFAFSGLRQASGHERRAGSGTIPDGGMLDVYR